MQTSVPRFVAAFCAPPIMGTIRPQIWLYPIQFPPFVLLHHRKTPVRHLLCSTGTVTHDAKMRMMWELALS